MCGFAGFFGEPIESFDKVLGRMAALRHRGPDDSGMWYDESAMIGLAHTRLSIVELSKAGHQPMVSSDGRFVLVFNGEIYNHLTLRKSVDKAKCSSSWHGTSDTESLLEYIVVFGVEKALIAMTGMFSFALWDRDTKQITLARDRMGEKPLYYGLNNGVLFFGSELTALKAHKDFKGEVCRESLSSFTSFGYIPSPKSIYRGIYKLSAGCYTTISCNGRNENFEEQQYWKPVSIFEQGSIERENYSDSESIALLNEKLLEVVSSQMLSDVPLGAFLSGGVDSSAIVSLMKEVSVSPVKTFAIGFEDEKFDEANYAKDVARHLGTEHSELYLRSKDALELIPSLSSIYDEPFADSSQLPTYFVSKLAKESVTVALSGDGGDELFGGYNHYQFAPKIWNSLRYFPGGVRRAASSLLKKYWNNPSKAFRKILDIVPAKDRETFYFSLLVNWQHSDDVVLEANNRYGFSEAICNANIKEFKKWMMTADLIQYVTDDILVKVDRAAMANSLETRVPLLDHRIIELAAKLPLNQKIRNGTGKWILREVLYKYVPRKLIERPKKGFSVPLGNWLRGPLREWAESLLNERRLREEGYFNSVKVRYFWEQHLAEKGDYSARIWNILMFQAWLDRE